MKRFGLAFALMLVGCANKPCDTTSQCGSGEVCAAAHCQAVSCSGTYYAVDPSDGTCRPLPACGNRSDVSGWKSCDDPCATQGENGCIADPRCQPAYTSNQTSCNPTQTEFAPVPAGVSVSGPACTGTRVFAGCRANQLRVDPCVGLDQTTCTADSRCTGFATGGGCDCPPGADCNCPFTGDNGWECRLKTCGDFTTTDECKSHSECTTDNGPQPLTQTGTTTPTGPVDAGVGGLDQPFFGCFDKGFGSCFSMDETTCLRHPECHPVGGPCYCPPGATCVCGGGKFTFCEPDDGLKRCNSSSECGADQRCNNDEQCAPAVGSSPGQFGGFGIPGGTPVPDGLTTNSDPTTPACPGLCVPKGCAGDGEQRCVNDPSCDAIYNLNCSPYGGGGGDLFNGGCGGGLPPQGPNEGDTTGGAAGVPAISSCAPCEPSFTQCVDRAPGSVIDADRSVLIRDPQVLDSPQFAFGTVMKLLAAGQDPAVFVDNWLQQIGDTTSASGKTANARPTAGHFVNFTMPRLADGRLDLDQIGFQVTSLSNRIDLAGPNDCGEARITYALKGGITDRRHRMTIIVELKQPDDGAACATVARKWVELSNVTGSTLRGLAEAIYLPLLAPEHLGQVRTNEFLVGRQSVNMKQMPWELREWHMGYDGQLHLALSKQAIDPTVVDAVPFRVWLTQNSDLIQAQKVIIPEGFLAVTSSEDGSRINLNAQTPDDSLAEQSLNQMACAGCHTTETNSVFTHVAERFDGTGRAKISEFLRKALPTRAQNLWKISLGRMDLTQRAAVKPTH